MLPSRIPAVRASHRLFTAVCLRPAGLHLRGGARGAGPDGAGGGREERSRHRGRSQENARSRGP